MRAHKEPLVVVVKTWETKVTARRGEEGHTLSVESACNAGVEVFIALVVQHAAP